MPDFAGEIVAHGLFRLPPSEVAAARRRPGPVPEGWGRVPPSLLRYSDEQTVAGVAAVFAALDASGDAPGSFADWGVVVASRFLGRASLAQALRSFAAEGVWGTSPHLIPHFALHSPAGSISLALGFHGPNLGVGGGVHAVAEGFLAALTWLDAGTVPGAWLVLSGWSPELIPACCPCAAPGGAECLALALALRPAPGYPTLDGPGPWVRIVAGVPGRAIVPGLELPEFAARLETPCTASPATIATDPAGRWRVELLPAGASEAPRREHEDVFS